MLKTYERRRLKRSREEDRLSNLPDDLLSLILSELPTKDLIRTSLSSRRLRSLCSSVPALDLDSNSFQDVDLLFEFIDRFLESNEEREVKRFKLVYDIEAFEHVHDDFVPRIDDVVKRRVCRMTVMNWVDGEEALVRLPLSVYSCGTLVDLTLYNVVFDDPEEELVSLPRLKTMHLEAVKFDGTWILKRLISSCSVLEKLVIVTHPGDLLGVVSVHSRSLKSFKLESMRETYGDASLDPEVEIDSPSLEYLSVSDYRPESFSVHSISPSAKVDIDVMFYDPLKRKRIHNFLTGLSVVREIIISARTLKVIKVFSQFEPLPQFMNLSCLDASFVGSTLELLPTFLGCCPNLQSLLMDFDCLSETDDEIKLSYVPQCFVSSLEFVLMVTPITVTKPALQMNLAKYFMRNCEVLKTLMVSESFSSIIKKIKRIPKRSGGCEVVMLNPCVVVHQRSSLSSPMF